MKILKKVLLFVFMGIIWAGFSLEVNAAERTEANNYIPNEVNSEESKDLNEVSRDLKEEIIHYGNDDYIITCDSYSILNDAVVYATSTTTNYSHVSEYYVTNTNTGERTLWYKITLKVNYTYNGSTVKINTEDCSLLVNTYIDACDYTVLTNTVYNTSDIAPYYTIKIKMATPNGYVTVQDILTVYADGTHYVKHTEE